MKILSVIILALVLFLIFRFSMLGKKSQSMNPLLGIENGKLRPCGPKPNCASGSFPAVDKNLLIEAVKEIKNAKVIIISENYLHATITSSLFGFVDDLEFYFPPGEPVIYYRSASRVGHSDLGQNQKRINQLTRRLNVFLSVW